MLLEREDPPESPICFSYGEMIRFIDGEDDLHADPLIFILSREDAIPVTGAPGYLAVTLKLKNYD